MKKLEQVRQKRLQGKTQSDITNDNDKSELLGADKIPTVSESIETFYQNKEVLSQLYPERIVEFERIVSNYKNTLKLFEFEKVNRLIYSLQSKGYDVNSENTQRIFYYVIDNPEDTENEVYLSRLIESLKLTKVVKTKPILGQRILTDCNLTLNSSSLVMDTIFTLMVGKGLNLFQVSDLISEKLCRGSKSFDSGNTVDVIFRDMELDLVAQYGEDTYQVFSILLAYWYRNKPQNRGETITISGDEILEILNEKNKLVKIKNKVKRLPKIEGLNWVAHHCELLKGIRVYSSIIPNGKGKNQFSIKENPLIEFSEIEYYPVGIIENYPIFDNIEDLHITFKVGNWFKYFDDDRNKTEKKYLNQFGYVHKKAFSSKGIESNLLHWLSFKLEQNQKGEFRIKTILEQIGLKERLNEVLSASDYRKKINLSQDIFREFSKALEFISSIDDPYQWEYKNAPQWLLDDSRKPRGWFNSWLDVVIVFKHPQCLIAEGKNYKREKVKPEAKPSKLTANDLKSALAQYSDNKNVSLRKLAEAYCISQPTLSRKLKSDKFTQQELKDLIRLTYFLGKK